VMSDAKGGKNQCPEFSITSEVSGKFLSPENSLTDVLSFWISGIFFLATPYFPAGMVQTPRLYSIPATKPHGTYRIFVLGESAAMGDPDSAYGFSRYLEVMLRARFPSMKFAVVNTGSVAINSHVVLRIAEGRADQKPDLYIIYSGNNEVVGPYGPGTMLTSGGMSMPVVRSSIFFRSTRIGQLLTSLGTKKREWHGMEMFVRRDKPA
jgi:hypothetical protein